MAIVRVKSSLNEIFQVGGTYVGFLVLSFIEKALYMLLPSQTLLIAYCFFVVLFIFLFLFTMRLSVAFFLIFFIMENLKHIQKQRTQYNELPFIQHPVSIVPNSELVFFSLSSLPTSFPPCSRLFQSELQLLYHFLAKYFRLYFCKIRNKKKQTQYHYHIKKLAIIP